MKKFLSLLLVCAMGMSIMACGKSDQPTPNASPGTADQQETKEANPEAAGESGETADDTSGKSGGTLHLGETAMDTDLASKNPFLPQNTKKELLPLMYDRLLYFNPVSTELEPALASEYEWNEDFTELTFTMNTDAKWQDGTDFTAKDVVYTYTALKDYPTLDTYSLWEKLDSITEAEEKVTFKFKAPFTAFVRYAAEIFIVPEHIWSAAGAPDQNLNEQPVGTGPFIYKTYNTGTDIQFDANKDYWMGAPKVDNLIVHIYNSSPNLTLALLKGEIAATFNTIAMANVPEFLTKEGAEMQVYAGTSNYSVVVNHTNELLSDKNIRKALSMAINQDDLITRGEYNGVFPLSPGWLPDIFGEMVSENAKSSHVFDVEAATKILEDAGYTKGKDGIYEKDGQRLSFTYYNQSGAPAQQMEAGMIQQWLLNIGVEIVPKLATRAELIQILQTGEFDLLQFGIDFPPDPYALLNTSFNSAMTAPVGTATPGTNYFRYENPEVDELLAQVAEETDEEKAKELYIKIQDILAEDVVFLPMYNLGAHIPYYDGIQYEGWLTDRPIISAKSLINVSVK
ncbi:ABC transporter substrate-binding protein [Ruminococcus gauvreauii]|uniref:Peptide ABC transporter substrate-binding protein n=1 Tax=Ruminococcus gauvreauii TaxID=438033 RepID=A0ABY5VKF3_9FIRM|nr:peptide ABC transporter substrate-binding protein [Ruminococcus gauvreauii]UWP60807.1 peptide ABC transporter substrate-binding protein [Ruminococcus gauvreauii]